jgi:hypothetical protein
VHGDVDAAVPLEGERVHALVVLGPPHVRADEEAADLVRDLLAAGHVNNDDVRALGGQPAAHRRADPAAATGDDGDPAVERAHSGVT